MTPIKDTVLVKVEDEEEQTTASGIILPPGSERPDDSPEVGKVASVGKEVEEIREGMTVYFKRFAGNSLQIDDNDFLLMKEKEILGYD